MNIGMPAVRLLFSGRDDAGKYIFTVLSYRPDTYGLFIGDTAISVTADMLEEFLSEHTGIILGDAGLNIKEGDAVAFAYIEDVLFYLENGTISRAFESRLTNLLKRICRGEVYLFDSGWVTEEIYQKLAVIKGAEETLFKATARNSLTREDLSHIEIADVVDGEVIFSTTGLSGTNSGVNIYSELVSEVTVGLHDIKESAIEVLDMSRCSLLRKFSIGKEHSYRPLYARIDYISVVFPSVIGDKPVGSVLLSANELRLVGVDRVIFSKVSVYKCLLSVDGELAVRSCNLLESVCGSKLHLRLISVGSGDDSQIQLYKLDIEELFIRAESFVAWKDKTYRFSGLSSLRLIDIEVPIEAWSVEFGKFIGYIFDNGTQVQFPKVSEIRVRFIGGDYFFGDKEYLVKSLFPSLSKLTIFGRKTGGDDRNLIVPDGCEIVYKE